MKPSLRRDVERLFWLGDRPGLAREDAAVAVGVSPAAGSCWFRERGGMPTFMLAPVTGRHLSFEEREEVALLSAQGAGDAGNWALHNPGCSRGLKPPVSSSDLAM